MRFTCSQQVLSKALNTVSKAITTRTTIPILKGILLSAADDNTLKLAASDLDLSIEKNIEASVSDAGSVVLSARLFGDIIRKLPNAEVEIEEMDNGSIRIRCLSSEFTIVAQPAEEFPSLGEINESDKLTVNKNIFKDMIRRTSFAASIDESKGIIVGVLIDMKPELLTMVALDGFRMAVTREQMVSQEERRIIIAARILSEIGKIIADTDDTLEDIDLIIDEKRAVFYMDDTKVMLRLLEGEFIKYEDILPKEHKCRIIADKSEFLDSIERASLLAKEGKNNLIKLSVGDQELTVTSRSEEGNVKEQIAIDKTGDSLEIGFNSKYVMDVLKSISDEKISMEFNTSISPCLIKPEEGSSFEYLILPVRISGS